MSKSIIRLLLGIAALAILLTGCSAEPDEPETGSAGEFASVSAGSQATPVG